jgi:ribosomal subunit interface protein
MLINIKATGLDLTPSLKEYIEGKLGGMARFINKYEDAGGSEMRVEVARTTAHHHKGNVFRAEVNLRLPHKLLRTEHTDRDVRTAIDMTKTKLLLEIEKYKSKMSPRAQGRNSK